jgi:hypothetical protein
MQNGNPLSLRERARVRAFMTKITCFVFAFLPSPYPNPSPEGRRENFL